MLERMCESVVEGVEVGVVVVGVDIIGRQEEDWISSVNDIERDRDR